MANDIYQFEKMRQVAPQLKDGHFPYGGLPLKPEGYQKPEYLVITFGMGITFGEGYCFGQMVQISKILADFEYSPSSVSVAAQGIEGSFRY